MCASVPVDGFLSSLAYFLLRFLFWKSTQNWTDYRLVTFDIKKTNEILKDHDSFISFISHRHTHTHTSTSKWKWTDDKSWIESHNANTARLIESRKLTKDREKKNKNKSWHFASSFDSIDINLYLGCYTWPSHTFAYEILWMRSLVVFSCFWGNSQACSIAMRNVSSKRYHLNVHMT